MRERLQRLGRPVQLAIATTASALMAVGAPPQGLTWLIWLGFVPLMLMLRVTAAEHWRWAFVLGFFGGMCTGLVGFPWIGSTLQTFGDFSAPVATVGLVLFSAWIAVPFGLWGIAVVRGPQRGAMSLVWPVVAWIAIELSWPAIFPYSVVIGFAEQPAWIQIAELGGVGAAEAQIVILGVLAADGILGWSTEPTQRRAAALRLAIAAALPWVSLGLGQWRLATIDAELATARIVRFGIVQPNVPLMSSRGENVRRLRMMSAYAEDEGAQVIVWPEAGVYPYRVDRPFRRDFRDPRRKIMFAHYRPTILGVASRDPGGEWEYNTVINMAADGTVRGSFDKTILVPFGEYVPVVDPRWAISLVPSMSHNNAGTEPARFEVQPGPAPGGGPGGPPFAAGPLVCYEDIFPGFAREVARLPGGIEIFVNVTIDTWFGATAEPWEHMALAQFRSVEHRIPMVRSVSAGVSSVIDAGGRLVAHAPVRDVEDDVWDEPERLVVDVALSRNTRAEPTFFARVGWLLPHACQLWVLLWLARLGLRRYRRRRSSVDPEHA
jgi:apolipoprotein N-acyltransferase